MGETSLDPGVNTIAGLYGQYELPIYRYLLRLCGSEAVARELTQETFFQVLTSWKRFQGKSSVKTWLYKIARNVYLHYIRDKARTNKLQQKIANENNAPQYTPSPETGLEEKRLRETVRYVLQLLPEQYRTVILLKEVENLSHREIADIMEKSEASVKVMLFRAKQKFREEFDRLEGSQ